MSAYATLGGRPVIDARVSFPRIGVWTAELRVDTVEALRGQWPLSIGGSAFLGTVTASRILDANAHVHMTGGFGGLRRELPAKGYISSPVSVPLQDIARETGEFLSPKSDSSVTNFQLRGWARTSGTAGNALAVLLDQVDGAVWRFLPTGELWVGLETWPKSHVVGELTSYAPLDDRVTFFSLVPGVLPGTTFFGRKASYVEHHVGPERLATVVWFEEE